MTAHIAEANLEKTSYDFLNIYLSVLYV